MTLGPIEVLVISFPGNQFNGGVIPELERIVGNDTISSSMGCSSPRIPTASSPSPSSRGARWQCRRRASRRFIDSGGVFANTFRIRGQVVDELLVELDELDDRHLIIHTFQHNKETTNARS